MIKSQLTSSPLLSAMRSLVVESRAPKLRTMREFAEQEIIIPSGQFAGMRFSCKRQPLARLWFDEVCEHREHQYTERVITGPSQSGKTLIGFVIPVLYHLFEMRETVIAAVPDYEMVRDKWEQDLEPVIARTRYRNLLPRSGAGSKGGTRESIRFDHGPILRFMTAGGRDKARAGYTSRVVCMTETDGFDVRTTTSSEADKIEQIEARTRSFPAERRRIYKECTLTTDAGHTWVRYSAGTASKIVIPCAHCNRWVSPEREDLHGWQNADSEVEAMRNTQFFCPSCGEGWTESQRRASNESCKLLHKGQEVDESGNIVGETDPTITLGFRWSAVNNLLVPASDIGIDEWRAKRALDEDNSERKMCQFVWAVPYKPVHDFSVQLQVTELQKRQSEYGRGVIPENATCVSVGVDVNLEFMHWTAIAWTPDGRGNIIDYGIHGIKHKHYTFDVAIIEAIEGLRNKLGTGWSENRVDVVAVDTRWETDSVVRAIRKLGDRRWRCFMGLGAGHWSRNRQTPEARQKTTIWIGDNAFERIIEKAGTKVITLFADANYWKTWLQNRLVIEIDKEQAQPGIITLYATTDANPHYAFCRHHTAEREVQRFEPGRGYLKVWEAIRSSNHWLDSTYMACVAAHRLDFGRRRNTRAPQSVRTVDQGEQRTWSAPVFHR